MRFCRWFLENWNSAIKAVKGVLQRESEMLHITNDDDADDDSNDEDEGDSNDTD